MDNKLYEIFNEKNVIIENRNMTWQEAVKIASEPLLKEGKITDVYVENMIKNVEVNGPYMVLTDYFALMHAKAGEGVNEVSMSLLVNNKNIDLEGKPVRIFMVLASVDKSSHLEYLQKISEILLDEDNFNTILNGKKEKILQIFKNN
ncbi:MAG: PTS sugar transporter subunit IIA [Miniphocaeibacter sp.]|uniref:PTS sugar transporter subunit IIA n=1 Tax=Miniphocaeibacter sp. TaxID=3100973 RepID=UPI0017F59C29|nr:PTS sugar transporter subunit IIA [Gallicola sp.]